MTEKLSNTIKEELAKLPKEISEAINSFIWVKNTEEIGKKYLLNESEINNLVVETLLVLISLERLDSFSNNIEENVGTSKNEADKISNEIVEKIFMPIDEILTENIKKNIKNKNHWEQNLDFILSGGDYASFVEKREEDKEPEEEKKMNIIIKTPKMDDIKAKLNLKE